MDSVSFVIKLVIYYILYFFGIFLLASIPLGYITISSGDMSLWVYALILGQILAIILSLVTVVIKQNKQKRKKKSV